jgi:hypothetical protein
MINFKLSSNDFKDLNVDYEILTINKKTFNTMSTIVEKSISNFNNEISWDHMFDLNEALYRINNDMEMYIGIIDNEPFGHVWFKDYLDGRLLFNLFVKNKVDAKKYSGTTLTSNILKKYELAKSPIYCEVNDWNEKSIKLFKKLGFGVI